MRALLLILTCFMLTSCGTLSLFPKSAPSEPRKLFDYTQSEKFTPKLLKTPTGEAYVFYETEKNFSTHQEETAAKLTFIQKVGRWIGGLTWVTLIFILIALAFFGGAPILWAVRKYYTIKSALRTTVAAIRDLSEEDYAKIKPILATKHDKRDRVTIDKVKSELQ